MPIVISLPSSLGQNVARISIALGMSHSCVKPVVTAPPWTSAYCGLASTPVSKYKSSVHPEILGLASWYAAAAVSTLPKRLVPSIFSYRVDDRSPTVYLTCPSDMPESCAPSTGGRTKEAVGPMNRLYWMSFLRSSVL
jgi:hypothetical protein